MVLVVSGAGAERPVAAGGDVPETLLAQRIDLLRQEGLLRSEKEEGKGVALESHRLAFHHLAGANEHQVDRVAPFHIDAKTLADTLLHLVECHLIEHLWFLAQMHGHVMEGSGLTLRRFSKGK